MIEFPISEPRLTGSGPNERLTCQFGETGRCDPARKKDQREFKEKLLQVSVPAVFLSQPTFSAPKTRVTMSRVGGARQFRWSGFVARFQSWLNTARSRSERIITLFAPDVNPAFLARLPRYAVLTNLRENRFVRGVGIRMTRGEPTRAKLGTALAPAQLFDRVKSYNGR